LRVKAFDQTIGILTRPRAPPSRQLWTWRWPRGANYSRPAFFPTLSIESAIPRSLALAPLAPTPAPPGLNPCGRIPVIGVVFDAGRRHPLLLESAPLHRGHGRLLRSRRTRCTPSSNAFCCITESIAVTPWDGFPPCAMRGAPLSPDAMRLSWGLLRLANGSTIRPRCGARSKPPRTPKRRRSRGRSRVGSWRTYRLRVLSQRFPSLLPLKPSGVTAGLCHWFPDVDLRRDPRSSPGRDRPEALGCPAPRVASPPVQFPGGDVPGSAVQGKSRRRSGGSYRAAALTPTWPSTPALRPRLDGGWAASPWFRPPLIDPGKAIEVIGARQNSARRSDHVGGGSPFVTLIPAPASTLLDGHRRGLEVFPRYLPCGTPGPPIK
jgi:hypothetical protein